MQIIYHPLFEDQLVEIAQHISLDKPEAGFQFAIDIETLIRSLPDFPLRYRKSIYSDDDNVRDMIFKKYTVIYEVNFEKNVIEILEIFNRNLPTRHP